MSVSARLASHIALISLTVLLLSAHAGASPSGPPFAWGETSRVASGGWGRLVHLHGSCWLCISTLFSEPNSILQIQVSTDNARTWTWAATLAAPGRDLDNGDGLRLPDGGLLLTCRSVVGRHRMQAGEVRSYHLPVYRSQDNGRTWVFQSQVSVSELPFGTARLPSVGLWEPHLFLLPGGRVACAYADETHARETPAYSQIVGERVSADSGRTWGTEIVLAAQEGGGGQRPGMPVVIRLRDKRYFAVYEVVGVGDADVYSKTSPDGVHWTPGLGTSLPGQHAGPWVMALQSGRLVVTSCDNQISYSDTGGATWHTASSPPFALGHVFSWPAIYQIGPREVVALISWHGVSLRRGRILEKDR